MKWLTEYKLNYNWISRDVCLNTRLFSADFRTLRRQADFADTLWPRNGGGGCDRLNGFCDCDDIQNDGCGEADRHLPATRNRQRHNELVEKFRRRQQQQRPSLPRTKTGDDKMADANENRTSLRQIAQSAAGDRSSGFRKHRDDGDSVVRRTDQAQTQTDFVDVELPPPRRHSTMESIAGSDRRRTMRPVNRYESFRHRPGIRSPSEGAVPFVDARRKKMMDIGPTVIDAPPRETTVTSKRTLTRRSGHPPSPSISFRLPTDKPESHGRWIASEKVHRPPPVYGYTESRRDVDAGKYLPLRSKAEKRLSSLNADRRSRSFSHLASSPAVVNHSSIWMSEYRRNFTNKDGRT